MYIWKITFINNTLKCNCKGRRSGNNLDLYPGGTSFESMLGHGPFYQAFVTFCPIKRMLGFYLDQVMAASFKIISNSSYNNHCPIYAKHRRWQRLRSKHNRKVTSSPNQDVRPAKDYSGLSTNLCECFSRDLHIEKCVSGRSALPFYDGPFNLRILQQKRCNS